MTFKKGFYFGLLVGILAVIAGVVYVNKVMEAIDNIDDINLEDLSLTDLEGNNVTISDYGDDKNILLNFWATWCKPCLEEFPVLDKTQKLVESDFKFVLVSDESFEKIKNFANKENYNFTYLKIDELPLGMKSLPQTYVLNKKLETKKYFSRAIEGDAVEIADSLNIWIKE